MRIAKAWTAVPVGLALAAAGCGGETTDVSGGVADFNTQLEPQGLSIECPKEVTGGENTEFDCTLKGKGQSKIVKLKITKEEDELVVGPSNQAEYDATVKELSGG